MPQCRPITSKSYARKPRAPMFLDRIARRHRLKVIYGAGDMSETRCQELMRRIVANGGRKVRLLYISDQDRALIATLTYSFARITAALKMKVEDLRPQGAGWRLPLREKGGKHHTMPCHHALVVALHRYSVH
jgi:hypothetical protein